ncbi:MAG: hypothetical protein FWH03_06380 [Firmicutes bacterium]|nr:hypothetical protein [Bacillota bacterium]
MKEEMLMVTAKKEPVIKKSNHKAIENYAHEMEMEADFHKNKNDLETAEKFYEKAFSYNMIAAEYGNAEAQWTIYRFYKNGCWVKQDYEKAAFWLARSFENGNIYASTSDEKINEIINEKLQQWRDNGWKGGGK